MPLSWIIPLAALLIGGGFFFNWKRAVEKEAVRKAQEAYRQQRAAETKARMIKADKAKVETLKRNRAKPVTGDDLTPDQKLDNLFDSFDRK